MRRKGRFATCRTAGCGGEIRARDYCARCYGIWYRGKEPSAPKASTPHDDEIMISLRMPKWAVDVIDAMSDNRSDFVRNAALSSIAQHERLQQP